MHDIRAIRDNPAAFEAALERRGLSGISATILKLDEARRSKILASETAQAAQNAASNAAAVLDDTAVTTKVKAAFAADPNLSAVLINVDTKDGVVSLSGPVKTPADAEHAAKLAQAVEGVKSVVHDLKPSAG